MNLKPPGGADTGELTHIAGQKRQSAPEHITATTFNGKVAIVTGAASGIGAAIVKLLVARGAKVVAADIDGQALRNDDPAVFNHVCDLTVDTQVNAMVAAAIKNFGQIDMLFNNAGIGSLAQTPDMTNEIWEKVFAINVTAVMYACRATIPHMRRQGGGAIVNTASISGLYADYGFDAYNASKGAVINYTKALAIDHAAEGIRVNAFCPGFIAGTGLTGAMEQMKPLWERAIPMGRGGTADEMAEVAAFLASDAASYLAGSIIVADGGLSAHTGQPNLITITRGANADRP